ncbi:MAG: T9SS type A sorting domain-containing protein [Bacteroidetes bacterium]|nr:T9SS type A sorting domain-containing protein [Bacteroidota bacterium]
MKTKILLLVFIALFAFKSNAQITGSFSSTVLFNSQSRAISCYVPTNYDSTATYQLMICLHGMGDNSDNYRNALINSLSWNTVFPNTIFICPDGGDDQNSDFSVPVGDEEIIQKSIDFAKQNYKIDTNKIILQGFSLGGRSALKYGLDNPKKFKGLLLNTPAVQGLDDALNLLPTGAYYNYTNPTKVPIYITYGANDDIYQYSTEKILDILIMNNSIVKLTTVAGVGHTIPNSTFTAPCIPFFNNPYSAPYDLEIYKIEMPEPNCDTTFFPNIYVRNLGSDTVYNFSTIGKLDGNFQFTTVHIGTLAPYHTVHVGTFLHTQSGIHILEDSIMEINGNKIDSITSNNKLSKSFTIENTGKAFPLSEGFEGNSDYWSFPKTGSMFEWYQDDQVFRTGAASIGALNTILLFYTNGDVESFLSPVMDLTSVSNPKLTFDYAYNYHKYTPPYFTSDVVFADTLAISISTDCGANYTTLFKKGGADLATDSVPILNPLTVDACFFIPTANQWKNKVIDLSNYTNEQNAIIKFSYISNQGGCINIDNINFTNIVNISEKDVANDVSIYPNPATDNVYIQYTATENAKMKLYNLLGSCVMQGDLHSGTNTIDVNHLAKGVYTIEITGENWAVKKKLMKE